MHPAVKAHHGDSGRVCLPGTADHGGNRPGEEATDHPVHGEGVLVLALDLTGVLPWNALRVASVLAEPVGEPRITLEVILEPVNVLDLHLGSGDGGRTDFKDLVGLLRHLVDLLVHMAVEGRLAEHRVVGVVELAWHV